MKKSSIMKVENIKRKLVLAIAMFTLGAGVILVGCDNTDTKEPVTSVASEVVSEEVSEIVTQEISDGMTIEEKIASEIPQKLEVGEDEIIVPETVTAEQIMARMEEIKVTDVEYAEDINKENLAALLVLNCSYMDPTEFKALLNEYFGSTDELMKTFGSYRDYLFKDGVYGTGTSILPEKLFFDEYLVNQAEQISYLIKMYQTDTENSKVYYDIIVDYLYRGKNEYLTFNYNDQRLEGSGLSAMQYIATGPIMNDMIEYDNELFDKVGSERTNLVNIVLEITE